VTGSAAQQERLTLLLDPANRWFIWDAYIDEPLTAKGDIISSADRAEMAFVLEIFREFHARLPPRYQDTGI